MVEVVEGLMPLEEEVEEALMSLEEEVEVQHCPQLDQRQQKVLKASVLFSFL